mmetsp:Transcript_21957/g.54317  ORF Transcript_21957/g.54317 Transcript_21957/m.54317 type:complete len:90 (+) Transcript_21957:48-317(+)
MCVPRDCCAYAGAMCALDGRCAAPALAPTMGRVATVDGGSSRRRPSFFERSSRRRALAAGNTAIFAAAERAQGGRCIVLGCTQGAPEVL